MNFLKSISLATIVTMLTASAGFSQLESIEDVESYGFRVNMVHGPGGASGSQSAGIQAIRWKIATAETEMKMLIERIASLNAKYDSDFEKQQGLKKELFQFGITGTVEDKLRALSSQNEDLINQRIALHTERDSLHLRLRFEMEAQASDKELAKNQHEILLGMVKLHQQELNKAKKMRESGSVSAHEVSRIELEFKEMELQGLVSERDLERESAAVRKLQLEIAETEQKLATIESLQNQFEEKRQVFSKLQATLSAEPKLKFDQQLLHKMIESYSLRYLDLELETIRLKALLSMVEGKLQEIQRDDSPNDDE